jgi:hypothetical protein
MAQSYIHLAFGSSYTYAVIGVPAKDYSPQPYLLPYFLQGFGYIFYAHRLTRECPCNGSLITAGSWRGIEYTGIRHLRFFKITCIRVIIEKWKNKKACYEIFYKNFFLSVLAGFAATSWQGPDRY